MGLRRAAGRGASAAAMAGGIPIGIDLWSYDSAGARHPVLCQVAPEAA